MSDSPPDVAIEFRIEATMVSRLPPTVEQAVRLDAYNKDLETICDRVQPGFQQIIGDMLDLYVRARAQNAGSIKP